MNSCRVILPSWSLSMRLKKSMTRDFLWFIQRMYFFLHTSKSKLANSFSCKTPQISDHLSIEHVRASNGQDKRWDAGTGRSSPLMGCRSAGYLLLPVQSVVEFPLAVQGQQPHLLPASAELVEPRVSSGQRRGGLLLLLACTRVNTSKRAAATERGAVCVSRRRTSSSPVSQAAGSFGWFPLVGFSHFVDVRLLPRHLLHEHLRTTSRE